MQQLARVDQEDLSFRDSCIDRGNGCIEFDIAIKHGTGPCDPFVEWFIGDKSFAPPDTQKYGGVKKMYEKIAAHIRKCWASRQHAPKLECWICDGVETKQRHVETFTLSRFATKEQAKEMGANGCPLCLLSCLYDVSEPQLSQYRTKVGGQSVQQRHGGRQ